MVAERSVDLKMFIEI